MPCGRQQYIVPILPGLRGSPLHSAGCLVGACAWTRVLGAGWANSGSELCMQRQLMLHSRGKPLVKAKSLLPWSLGRDNSPNSLKGLSSRYPQQLFSQNSPLLKAASLPCPAFAHFPADIPGRTSQINRLLSSPCLGVCFWEGADLLTFR